MSNGRARLPLSQNGDMASDLPLGSIERRVGDVFEMCGGGTPLRSQSTYWNGNIPWLSSGDIKTARISDSSEHITRAGLENSSAKLCDPGSVVIVVRSGILKHTFPVAVLDTKAAINQDIRALNCSDNDLNAWLALALRAREREIISENREGTTVQSVKTETIQNFALPIPPLAEQQRIVAALDAVLAKVASCRERLAGIPTLLKRFRQAVLAAACSGRLTADWREQQVELESAPQLIKRLRAQRNGHSNLGPLVRSDLELFDLPPEWAWVDLKFVMSPHEPFCYGVVQPGADDPNGVFLVRAGDLKSGAVDLADLRRIPMSVDESYPRSRLRGGEILVTVVGAGIGEVAIAQPECTGFNIARAVAKIPVREMCASYIYH